MAMLGPADVAFLDRGRAVNVGEHGVVVDAEIGEDLPDAAAVVVVADDTGDGDPGPERAQHGGDAAGAAEAFFALIGAQQDYRRLLADALGVAPYVAVEHEIADDQHARLSQALD